MCTVTTGCWPTDGKCRKSYQTQEFDRLECSAPVFTHLSALGLASLFFFIVCWGFFSSSSKTSSSGRRRPRAIEVIRGTLVVCVHFNFLEESKLLHCHFFATSERKTLLHKKAKLKFHNARRSLAAGVEFRATSNYNHVLTAVVLSSKSAANQFQSM